MADQKRLTVKFRRVDSEEEQANLLSRGGVKPQDFKDAYRFAGPSWIDSFELMLSVKTLIFFKRGKDGKFIARALESACSISQDSKAVYLPFEVVPEVFRQAMAEGAVV